MHPWKLWLGWFMRKARTFPASVVTFLNNCRFPAVLSRTVAWEMPQIAKLESELWNLRHTISFIDFRRASECWWRNMSTHAPNTTTARFHEWKKLTWGSWEIFPQLEIFIHKHFPFLESSRESKFQRKPFRRRLTNTNKNKSFADNANSRSGMCVKAQKGASTHHRATTSAYPKRVVAREACVEHGFMNEMTSAPAGKFSLLMTLANNNKLFSVNGRRHREASFKRRLMGKSIILKAASSEIFI